jgi:hypothetical protein
MLPFRSLLRLTTASALISLFATQPAWAWGRDGHMIVNRLAVQYLPKDVPAFLRDKNAVKTIEYLGPEPDRWKNRAEDELYSAQSADHFLDEEYADVIGTHCDTGTPGCSPAGTMLPKKRYDFIRALAAAQPSHPDLPLQPDKVGMLPWQVEEVWQRLKSDMRDYRKLVAAHEDTTAVKDIILYETGWLGHYVADGSQPLHASIEFNGWTAKDNPNGYTTGHKIHAQFESVYISANLKPADVAPLVAGSKPEVIDDEWTQYLDYLHHSNSLVEKTYQLEKAQGFSAAGTPEAKAFADERLAAGVIELRNLIYSAWVHSADPVQEYKGPQ